MRNKLLVVLILGVLLLCACTSSRDEAEGADTTDHAPQDTPGSILSDTSLDEEGFRASLHDWVLGTQFGIDSARLEVASGRVILKMDQSAYDNLTNIDQQDIRTSVDDLLAHYGADPQYFSILFKTQNGMTTLVDSSSPGSPPETTDEQTDSPATDNVTNLIFIHHSCGENWLSGGLNTTLNEHGYHVADITYGWREYGDNTDTADWPTWFTDNVMRLVYNETGAMTASNSIPAAAGENEIVMFKSCFPCSDVGASISDEQAVYNALIPYFEAHPGKMFILITPPPMINISTPQQTRKLTNWLIDKSGGWLAELKTKNVFVFDFYNVLTHPDAHHYAENGEEIHTVVDGVNELYYDSGGDDHPNAQGNAKAAEEFISLLTLWRAQYLASR